MADRVGHGREIAALSHPRENALKLRRGGHVCLMSRWVGGRLTRHHRSHELILGQRSQNLEDRDDRLGNAGHAKLAGQLT